ncbi:MAG: carbohydrate-binding protein [Rhodobacteraceae bacterium]|nr:carbohydrate-binding protein [Paracoccaceae bacterium]
MLGSIAVPETGGWQTWETIEAALAPVTGSHSLFLKFVESGSSTGNYLFNLNWFSIVVPPLPVGLSATPNTATQTILNWTAAAGAGSYELWRATVNGGPYTMVASGVTNTTFTNAGLTAGTGYYYVLRAVYAEVTSPYSTEIRTVPSDPINPADVTVASTVIGSDGAGGQKITLTIANSGLGHFHQAQSSPALTSGSWTNASGVVMGTGGPLQIDVPISPGAPRSFYKVNVWRE